MTRAPSTAASILVSLLLAACSGAPPPPRPEPPAPRSAEVTILFTSDEHGWVLPFSDRGRVRGGAAEMLHRWKTEESHCPGDPSPEEKASPACADPGTIALSGGDTYTGPAIATYFEGRPMAEAIARMGYAASAFGNHEFDFGRAAFLDLRSRARVTYLAANLHAPPSDAEMRLPSFAIVERRGVKIGVVGLATESTLVTAMASRFGGITFEAPEPALDRAVKQAWAAGPDAVAAIVHECADVLAPIVARHPEWKLSFVGGGHCHRVQDLRGGSVPVISPGWRLEAYARVRLRVERREARGERPVSAEASIVDISRPEGGEPAPADPVIARAAAGYRARLDQALGEVIGYSATGLERSSPQMIRWLTGALREETGADVAILNKGGIRQGLPRGAITKAAVWSILPFDNKVVTFRQTGRRLRESLAKAEIVASGVTARADGSLVLASGAPLDPDALYRVATIDFLFLGGDDAPLRHGAADVEERSLDWRTPIIEWTRKKRTDARSPLEQHLRGATLDHIPPRTR